MLLGMCSAGVLLMNTEHHAGEGAVLLHLDNVVFEDR